MCQDYQWVVSAGSFLGVIQSIIWMGAAIIAALTYLCVIPVPPYDDDDDFFKITLVKLYFEGPNCKINGSYLGKFNEEYKKLSLFTPDLVLSVMVAYFILNAFYFILSSRLYSNRNKKDKRDLAFSWSGLTLIICIVDFFFSYLLFIDHFTLKDHMSHDSKFSELNDVVYTSKSALVVVPYISLVLAFVSIRFIVIWLWNSIIGIILFFDSLCFKKIVRKSSKPEKKTEEKPIEIIEEPKKPKEDAPSSVSLLNGKYMSAFDIRTNPNYLDVKKSMEAVTRFPTTTDAGSLHRENTRHYDYDHGEPYWHPSKSQMSKEWEMTNEGYISDEPEAERQFDFDHNLKNFESGQRKIKIVKPPVGKPVSIPVPPPLPTSGSCNC